LHRTEGRKERKNEKTNISIMFFRKFLSHVDVIHLTKKVTLPIGIIYMKRLERCSRMEEECCTKVDVQKNRGEEKKISFPSESGTRGKI